jgi:hypothetical protein
MISPSGLYDGALEAHYIVCHYPSYQGSAPHLMSHIPAALRLVMYGSGATSDTNGFATRLAEAHSKKVDHLLKPGQIPTTC